MEKVFINKSDLEEFLDSTERVAESAIESDVKKAEFAGAMAEYKRDRLNHSRKIRELSKIYDVPLYSDDVDIDVLTGEVTQKGKENAGRKENVDE